MLYLCRFQERVVRLLRSFSVMLSPHPSSLGTAKQRGPGWLQRDRYSQAVQTVGGLHDECEGAGVPRGMGVYKAEVGRVSPTRARSLHRFVRTQVSLERHLPPPLLSSLCVSSTPTRSTLSKGERCLHRFNRNHNHPYIDTHTHTHTPQLHTIISTDTTRMCHASMI